MTSSSFAQLLRFCIVGGCCYLATLATLTGLVELAKLNYVTAFVIAFLFGNVLGYALNGKYTFRVSATRDRPSLSRYVLVNCLLLAFNTFALRILVERFGIWYVAATVLLAIANIPASFVIHKTVSYRRGPA